ncbi:MAG: glycosyltransferase family 4 protein [Dehalococcoidia bacterium]
MSRRILILNLYYPPDTGATAKIIHEVAEALSERCRVTVLAGRPSYAPEKRHPYYLFCRERWGAVTVERVGSTAFHRRRMPGRVSNYLSYMALALIRTMSMRPKPDLIITMTDPPLVVLLAALVKALRRCPFVYNIRDLHPDMAVTAGIVRSGLLVKLWERLHRRSVQWADLVVVLGQEMRRRVVEKGVEPARAVVVRDGAPAVESVDTGHAVAREIRGEFPFVVLHAGNLGFAGAWETLIGAARCLDGEGAGFVFVGDGAERARLEARAEGCSNVRFLPFRPASEIPLVMAAGDLHVVTVRRGLEGLVVPSKLYTTLAAGRQILAVVPEESDVAQIVRETGCGFVADPDDSEAIAQSVRFAISRRELLVEMGQRARAAALTLARDGELQRFVNLVEGLSGGENGRTMRERNRRDLQR